MYVCTLDIPANRQGMYDAEKRLAQVARPNGKAVGAIHFHELDLGSVSTARTSAIALVRKLSSDDGDSTPTGRLDILNANAALTFPTQDVLSPDGVERTFAVNCLGHFVFVTTLLGTCTFLLTSCCVFPASPLEHGGQKSDSCLTSAAV